MGFLFITARARGLLELERSFIVLAVKEPGYSQILTTWFTASKIFFLQRFYKKI